MIENGSTCSGRSGGSYARIVRRAGHRIRVYAYSAVPLAEDFQTRIKTAAQNYFKLEPVLVLQID